MSQLKTLLITTGLTNTVKPLCCALHKMKDCYKCSCLFGLSYKESLAKLLHSYQALQISNLLCLIAVHNFYVVLPFLLMIPILRWGSTSVDTACIALPLDTSSPQVFPILSPTRLTVQVHRSFERSSTHLGAFSQSRKVPISFFMSACPSVRMLGVGKYAAASYTEHIKRWQRDLILLVCNFRCYTFVCM